MKGAKAGLWIVIAAISLGLIGVTSWVAKNSTEYRSRAAIAREKTYKAWEFAGSSNTDPTEGWSFTNFSGTRVSGGVLEATFSKKNSKTVPSATLTNGAVFTTLPYGAKSLRMRLSADTPTKDGRGIPGTVTYRIKDKTPKSLSFTAPEGQFVEVKLAFAEVGAISIDTLEISFTNYQPGSKLAVDWIRLMGAVSQPTGYPTKGPTPTFSPKMTPTPYPTAYTTMPPQETPTAFATRPPTPPPKP